MQVNRAFESAHKDGFISFSQKLIVAVDLPQLELKLRSSDLSKVTQLRPQGCS